MIAMRWALADGLVGSVCVCCAAAAVSNAVHYHIHEAHSLPRPTSTTHSPTTATPLRSENTPQQHP